MKITELQPHQFILPKSEHEIRVLLALVQCQGVFSSLLINDNKINTSLPLAFLSDKEIYKAIKTHFASRTVFNIRIGKESINHKEVRKYLSIRSFSFFDLEGNEQIFQKLFGLEKPIEILSLSDIEYNEEKLRKWGIYPEVTFPSMEESLAKIANTLVEIIGLQQM